MDDPRDVFPERLAEELDARRLPAREFAAIIDVTPATVEGWVDGTMFPCPRHFTRVTTALGVTRDDLLCR